MYILVTYDVDTTNKAGARRLRHVAKAPVAYGMWQRHVWIMGRESRTLYLSVK